jgi:hypothetical protein
VDYTVVLQTRQPYHGGIRWWFTRPLKVDGRACYRRVGKLYLPPGGLYFGCRHCYDLSYRSVQEHDKCVAFYRNNPDVLLAALESIKGDHSNMSKALLVIKAMMWSMRMKGKWRLAIPKW